MDKGFETSDIKADIKDDGNSSADFGGNLAGDVGVDLNAGDASKAGGLDKAIMSSDLPPPKDNTMTTRSPDSAIYTEAPSHAGRTPEQVTAEITEAWGYAGPANESGTTKDPSKPEHADSPPDDKK